MCGNGVIATVAEWIGYRLVYAERLTRTYVRSKYPSRSAYQAFTRGNACG